MTIWRYRVINCDTIFAEGEAETEPAAREAMMEQIKRCEREGGFGVGEYWPLHASQGKPQD
jgi:hypothetical protein